MTQNDFWMMTAFNPLFFGVFGIFILMLVVASIILKNKSDKVKTAVLVTACVLTLIGFGLYKYFLSLDADFKVINAEMGGFNWWGELPLHLCNVNMILIPIAVLKKNKHLMSFCFFVGPLGALIALAMPGTGFNGYSLLLPRMLGYFGTHYMIFIEGLAIVTFGLYKPRFKDLPGTLITIFLITLVIFGINMLLRWSGLHTKANYFFSVETEGNFILDIFYRWIPFPFLYLLPCAAILTPYMLLITLPFELARKKKASGK